MSLMFPFRVNTHGSGCLSILRCILFVAFLASLSAQGQCPPIANPAQSQPSATQNNSSGQPEFFDEPHFTVAGVTDTTNIGGHGTEAGWRTKEALARETVSLKKGGSSSQLPSPNATAEQSLRNAAEHDPTNFDANYRLGKSLVADDKIREAQPYLENALRLSEGKEETAELHGLLGDVEEKLNNPLKAVQHYQRAAELDPSENNFFNWGAELLMHAAPQPAIEVFSKGNHLFPQSVRMLVGLGVAWDARGSYDPAAKCLCEASDLNPADPTPYLFLGKMQSLDTANSQGITQRLARFARLQPENALANYYYALNLWQRRKGPEDVQDLSQVQSLLEKAVQLDPKLGLAYLQSGVLYSERKEYSKAISAYQRAIAANPDLERAHYHLAQAYRLSGDQVKAKAELEIYERVSKTTAAQAEQRRHEIQQFVYTLREASPTASPPQP